MLWGTRRPVLSGSGKSGTPCERMHLANCSSWLSICGPGAAGEVASGARCRQAFRADWYTLLLTPRLFGLTCRRPFAAGSGKSGTPRERMHCATASSSWWSDDAPVEEEPPAPVGVLPPQAAVSRAVTTRACRTPARRRPVSLFIVAILESRNWLLSRQLYAAGGNSTVTGNVTWLSPATCDPGSRRECAAMRVLLAEDDEILARTVGAGLRQEGMGVDGGLDGGGAPRAPP